MLKYTNNNGELRMKHLNKDVSLRGWVSKKRDLGGVLFIDLRDKFGVTQLIIKPNSSCYDLAVTIKNEYVIEVSGRVAIREKKNPNLVTGDIEVVVAYLNILSQSLTPPISIANELDSLEETRLKYRYLDLRRPVMQNFLIRRHQITQIIRKVLLNNDFLELETPILGKSTPEGARDFLIPSRLYNGQFYALPQSPQMYKQLYMIAGFERYFQFARCFRDEDLRADRQLEFTQVDIEISFASQKTIMSLTEKVFVALFKDLFNVRLPRPFKTIKYQEAIAKYGSDKPDNRFALLINDYTAYFKSLDIPFFKGAQKIRGLIFDKATEITRKKIDRYTEIVKQNHGESLSWLTYKDGLLGGSLSKSVHEDVISSLNLFDNAILFLVKGDYDDVSSALGALRLELGKEFKLFDEKEYSFLWITDFPLLEYSDIDQRFYAKHHPFTAPKSVDVLSKRPHQALAQAYDIVLNGYEIGGGSIRIHDSEVQKLMFKTLSFSEADIKNRFGFFVDALKYGTPPHGGIAFGLDRIVMLLTNTSNIKDVIAFPKTQSARDLMNDAPSAVDLKQLDELGIQVKN